MKRLKEQVRSLTKQSVAMAARLEDQERRARRNNIQIVGGAQASQFGPPINQAMGISDHSPVEVQLRGPSRDFKLPPRLDAWSLRDTEIQEKLREGMDPTENRCSVSSSRVLWEAFKSLIRGQAQAIIGARRKDTQLEYTVTERDIAQLEEGVRDLGKPEEHHELRLHQQGLRAENQARKHALVTQCRLYDVGKKASKLLAM
ncbi:hypothetical protein NDU88_003919 [Pleurodeles waltl]|uniref:Uncharacterized protein n=1 Tax=Pleurodeles waltl TaxID=8319 RepID=A0AAV7MWZ9_PLEWA|nr:hypothetical protein NDU88_003919 [Pleurodeles waltl]